MTTAQLLNGMYAIARKKSALNHQEQQLIRTAAAILEKTLKEKAHDDMSTDYRQTVARYEDDWDDMWPLK